MATATPTRQNLRLELNGAWNKEREKTAKDNGAGVKKQPEKQRKKAPNAPPTQQEKAKPGQNRRQRKGDMAESWMEARQDDRAVPHSLLVLLPSILEVWESW